MNKNFLKRMVKSHTGFIFALFCIIPVYLSAQTETVSADTPQANQVEVTPVEQPVNGPTLEEIKQEVQKINQKNIGVITDYLQSATSSLSDRIDSSTLALSKQMEEGIKKTREEISTLSEEESDKQITTRLNSIMGRMAEMESKLSKEISATSNANRKPNKVDKNALYIVIAAIFALVSSLLALFIIYQNIQAKASKNDIVEPISESIKDLKRLVANVEASEGGSGKSHTVSTASNDSCSNGKIESSLKALLKKIDSLDENMESLKESSLEQAQVVESSDKMDALWPWLVEKGNPLEGWKDRLLDGMNNNQNTAFELYIALLEASQNLNVKARITQEKAVEIIDSVATRLYLFLYEKEDLVKDDLIDLPTQWIKAIRTLIEPVLPALEIKAAYPGDALNHDSMEKIDDGKPQTVKKPYSWVISDKSGEAVRFIIRAKVTTE